MGCNVFRGDIVYVRLDPTVGLEMKKTRPCVVVQNDVGNRVLNRTIIVPVTDADHVKKLFPAYVAIKKGDGGLKKDSVVECDQIRVVHQDRFGGKLGRLSPAVMAQVDEALKRSLGLP